MILGDLALGYQRGWIAARWAAQARGAQGDARVSDLFFPAQAATRIDLEEETGGDAEADPVRDEPVIPYTREDIARGLVRVSQSGNYALSFIGGWLDLDTSTDRSRTGWLLHGIGYDVESLSEPRAEAIAWMLGSWGRNESAWLRLTVERGSGGEAFALETPDAEAGRFRRMDAGGGREAPSALRHHAAAVRPDVWTDPLRGTHVGGRPDRGDVSRIPWADVPGGAYPRHDSDLAPYWRKDHAP
jgi:hypothetical protein